MFGELSKAIGIYSRIGFVGNSWELSIALPILDVGQRTFRLVHDQLTSLLLKKKYDTTNTFNLLPLPL